LAEGTLLFVLIRPYNVDIEHVHEDLPAERTLKLEAVLHRDELVPDLDAAVDDGTIARSIPNGVRFWKANELSGIALAL
jgi:hypothetical protein